MYNETNSPLHSRNKYPRSTETHELRKKRDRLQNIGLGAAAIGIFTAVAFNSDKVDEPPRPTEQTTTIDHVGGNTQVDVQYEESTQTITFNQQPSGELAPNSEVSLVEAGDDQSDI